MNVPQRWGRLLLFLLLSTGCVTKTERLPYYRYSDPPRDESVLDELRREFGWQKTPSSMNQEPFYTRAVRSVKNTVSGWFQRDEEVPAGMQGGQQSFQQFKQEQEEAIHHLQEQQEQEKIE